MKNKRKANAVDLIVLMILVLSVGLTARAQSTDIDQPTVLTSNVIEGEGDGTAETFYYTFTALKGDVKVTLDSKTDNYSVIMDAALTTGDGKELLRLSAVANDTGKREVGIKHFVRETKVILRVRLPKDEHLKLLTFKIKLDGAVKVETPPTPEAVIDPAVGSTPTNVDPAAAAAQAPPPAVEAAPTSEPVKPDPSLKSKAKTKAKTETKKVLKSVLD